MSATIDDDRDGSTELSDRTAVEQIESIYARIGLATAHDRAAFLFGAKPPAGATFDVVITTTSQPF